MAKLRVFVLLKVDAKQLSSLEWRARWRRKSRWASLAACLPHALISPRAITTHPEPWPHLALLSDQPTLLPPRPPSLVLLPASRPPHLRHMSSTAVSRTHSRESDFAGTPLPSYDESLALTSADDKLGRDLKESFSALLREQLDVQRLFSTVASRLEHTARIGRGHALYAEWQGLRDVSSLSSESSLYVLTV